MSGSTPELALKTAVDSDDTADYLTLALADSLRTVDALYNNVTGHTHNGAHQGGPIGTIPAGAIPDGTITSAKIADGTIATADLANAAVTNAKLASDTARANLLTNGGFEIWQRGNGPFTSGYSADRWIYGSAGTDAMSVSRNTANVDFASAACAAVSFTLSGGGGNAYYGQKIEDCAQLRGRTVTFSCRVYAGVLSAVRLGIWTGSAYVYGSSNSATGTYVTLTVTATIDSNATSVYTNVFFAASCTAYLDNAMLVIGNVAAEYAPLHPADDLARCLRYYERIGEGAQTFYIRSYAGDAATHSLGPVYFKVQKAVTPTLTKVGIWTVTNCGQPTFDAPSINHGRLLVVPTAAGVFNVNSVDTTTYLQAEANP